MDERLRGDPFRCGFEHGRAWADQVRRCVARYGTFAGASPSRVAAVVDAIAANLQRRYPAALAEIQGIAEGSGVSTVEILALNCCEEIWAETTGWPAMVGCSNFAVDLPTEGPLLAHTADVAAGDAKLLVAGELAPAEGYRLLWLRYAGTLWCAGGVNERGLAVAGSSLQGIGCYPSGLPSFLFTRMALTRAATTAEAVALAAGFAVYSGGSNLLVQDAAGDGAVIEFLPGPAGGRIVARRASSDWLWCTNHPLADVPADRLAVAPEFLANSRARGTYLTSLDRRCPTSLDDVFRLLSAPPLCQANDAGMFTEAAMVLAPARRAFWLARGRPRLDAFERFKLANDSGSGTGVGLPRPPGIHSATGRNAPGRGKPTPLPNVKGG